MWLMLQLDKDERVVDARSEMMTTLIAQIIRFARPNIQIYDARVVDLYQRVCARYLVGVKGAETKARTIKLGSRPNFRTDHAGFQDLVPRRSNPGINHRKTKICFIFQ